MDHRVIPLQLIDQHTPVLLVVVDLEVADLSDVEQEPLIGRGNVWEYGTTAIMGCIFGNHFQVHLTALTSRDLGEQWAANGFSICRRDMP